VLSRIRLGGAAAILVAASVALTACGSDNGGGSTGGGSTASGTATPSASISCATGSIKASGSTAQANAMNEWVKDYQDACSGSTINYQGGGSSAGRTQFIAGQVDFAGSDAALADPQTAKATARCTNGQAIDLPMAVGPISLMYNLSGVSNLQLSAPTLAKIFSGKITKWNDPAITAENSGASLPSTTIQTVHRSDGSGTTQNFTSFLAGVDAADWTFGTGSDWKAPKGQGSKGSDGVTQTVKTTPGAIGYAELSYAENANMSTAKIKNGAGAYVEVSTDGASKALSTATIAGTGADLKLKFDYSATTAGAYPVYLVTYEIVCTKGLPASNAALVKSFMTYTSSTAGQSAITDLGYAALPTEVASKVQSTVATLS
jgi:phosphate transport system substrate-binding protein